MSLARANDNVRDALSTLTDQLHGWLASERQRESVANEIASLEGFVRELKYLKRIRQRDCTQEERIRQLTDGAEHDMELLAQLQEERRRHEVTTARLGRL